MKETVEVSVIIYGLHATFIQYIRWSRFQNNKGEGISVHAHEMKNELVTFTVLLDVIDKGVSGEGSDNGSRNPSGEALEGGRVALTNLAAKGQDLLLDVFHDLEDCCVLEDDDVGLCFLGYYCL